MTEIRTLSAAANGGIPNHPHWPALLLPGAFAPGEAEALLRAAGWGGIWRWGVYDHHHFHPNAHEALLCVAGAARLQLGGPEGAPVEVSASDALVLPAGFGHRCLSARDGFAVLGAYPPGQAQVETEAADPEAPRRFADRIAAVPRPRSHPLGGGPFPELWPPRATPA
ncbi:cupin [Limimaricola pyoseonensis]|uniref:Uncharacterized protein YjlB n=1 Tax=Limimaricola pyoseonensis TaxID=521013 RepID=A0A1G7G4A2_9RHOB|nr:cupin [Limimaricola pyoseonensis]SDE82951.1 Uncharacterized protein YjlB [Limimaricola pyoseonensis]